ncbi:MAG: class IV adenylate cyclase [Candidatus Pacebacteria bacterium]|nr:class IV adenylate cyclase [Candidatus Paceibacterota bacterium]
MNIEIEIKVKIDDFEAVKNKVSEVGSLIKKIKQIDSYYIPYHRDFFAHKPHPVEWLRIRENPDKIVFEYTKSINQKEDGDYDYAEEYETEISDKEEFEKILDFLDFKLVTVIEKEREYWMCKDIEVALDKVNNLGFFIEAEAKGNFKNEKEAKKACINFLENIGLKDIEKTQTKKGYPQMMLEK